MSQGTFPLSCSQSGTEFSNDLNDLLKGIDSSNSGNTAPAGNIQAGKLWLDTSQTPPILKIYDTSVNQFVPLNITGDAFRTVVIYKNLATTPDRPLITNTVLNGTLDGFAVGGNSDNWELAPTTPGSGVDTYTSIGTFKQEESTGNYTIQGNWSIPAQLSGDVGSDAARSPIIGFYVPLVTRVTSTTFTSVLADFDPVDLLNGTVSNQNYLDASFSQFFFGNLTSDAVGEDYGVFYNNSNEDENIVASYDAANDLWVTGVKRISGNLLVDGSITAISIKADAVQGKTVSGGKDSLTDTTSGFFLDSGGEFVVGGDANNQLKWDGSNLTIPAATITGTLTASDIISSGSITANEIATGTITTTQLAADSITADKIASLELSVEKNITVGSLLIGADTELSVATVTTDPGNKTITVDSTADFPSAGTVSIGEIQERFAYTSKTATTLVSTTDTIDTVFPIDTEVSVYVVRGDGTGVSLEGRGRFAVGNELNALTFDGSVLTISGVELDAGDLANLSSLDGKISSSLQTYADSTPYAEGSVVIDDTKIWRVKAGQTVPSNNTANPGDNSTDWEEISASEDTSQGATNATNIATNASGIATNVTNIATNASAISTNTSGIATNVTNIATNASGISTNTSGIATNVTNIATNASGISTNTSGIATNVTNIATNASGISTNASAISTNTSGIATNVTNIATNASAISTNTSGIATNVTNIATNASGISTNASAISTNTSGIATNVTNIATNASAISTNTSGIATNVTNIATNASGISTNASAISTNTSGIATNVTNIATNASAISTNTSGIATNVTNIATNASGISTNASAISTNTSGIATNVTNIATNASGISTNASAISTNTSGIATNVTNIATNASGISTNTSGIATNVTNIATNASGISTNASAISTNTSGIATNVTNIATNASGISTNASAISTNTSGISTNASGISTNASGISTNASAISTNASAISTNATTDYAGQTDAGNYTVPSREDNDPLTTTQFLREDGIWVMPDIENGSVTLDKLAISEFPTVVWKTSYKTRDSSPDADGEWQPFTDNLSTAALNDVDWGTLKSVRMRAIDENGRDISELVKALGAGSYIRINQESNADPSTDIVDAGSFVATDTYVITTSGNTNFEDIGATDNLVGTRFIATGVGAGTGKAILSNFGVYKVGTIPTSSTTIGEITFASIFQKSGDYRTDATNVDTSIDFQVNTDAIIDGNLIVTGTIDTKSIKADTAVFETISADTGNFGSVVADVGTFGTLRTGVLNAGVLLADFITANSITANEIDTDTLTVRAANVIGEITVGSIRDTDGAQLNFQEYLLDGSLSGPNAQPRANASISNVGFTLSGGTATVDVEVPASALGRYARPVVSTASDTIPVSNRIVEFGYLGRGQSMYGRGYPSDRMYNTGGSGDDMYRRTSIDLVSDYSVIDPSALFDFGTPNLSSNIRQEISVRVTADAGTQVRFNVYGQGISEIIRFDTTSSGTNIPTTQAFEKIENIIVLPIYPPAQSGETPITGFAVELENKLHTFSGSAETAGTVLVTVEGY